MNKRKQWQFDPRRAFHGTMLQGMPPLTPRVAKARTPTEPNEAVQAAAEAKRARRRARLQGSTS